LAGTSILEAEGEAIAVVIKISSHTAKGEMLREIFSFRRHTFKFDNEVYIVLGILVLLAIFGFSVTLYLVNDIAVTGWFYAMVRNASQVDQKSNCCRSYSCVAMMSTYGCSCCFCVQYVVAAALPPILPTTFTVSVGVSNARLANKRIACANSASILVAGKVTRAFFDKTGTLTTQGLDFKSARSANDWTSETISDDMNMAMASCHAATLSSAGLLVGNPVDSAMFTASGATSDASRGTSVITDCNGNKLEVVRHYDFDHHRMTQSVIVKLSEEKDTYVSFVKGSGESISKICTYDSLPSDFDSSVRNSAATGIYQIAVAMKHLDAGSVATISRDDVEKDCAFVGVLNFLNTLREETPDVVRQLAAGAIESTVVTGDNTMNGIRAAREAEIITANMPVIIGNVRHHDSDSIVWTDESGNDVGTPSSGDLERNKIQLAMSGKAWLALRINDPKVAIHIAPYVRVFGRCTPYDKVSVVDTFVKLGFITMMCGTPYGKTTDPFL
jgi:magnesium-transporting ATPase (P-type)